MKFEKSILEKEGIEVNWEWIYLGSILLAAVLMDLKSEKIKNELICLGLAGIVLKVFLAFSAEQVIESCLGFLIPIIGLFILFYFHMLGAGDIKLLAVTGGFLGIEGSLFCVGVSFIIGACFAFIKMCIHRLFIERFAYFFQYMKDVLTTGKRIPYYDLSEDKDSSRLHFSVSIALSAAVYVGMQILRGM